MSHPDAAQRRPVRRQRGSIAWEPIPAWRPAGFADLQTSFADPCARSTAPAGPAGHLPGLHQLGLTPRDREALALVADGRSNRQITEALFFSLKTAGVHVSNILAKLGVAGRSIAHRLGLDCWSLRRRRHQARACHYLRQATRP